MKIFISFLAAFTLFSTKTTASKKESIFPIIKKKTKNKLNKSLKKEIKKLGSIFSCFSSISKKNEKKPLEKKGFCQEVEKLKELFSEMASSICLRVDLVEFDKDENRYLFKSSEQKKVLFCLPEDLVKEFPACKIAEVAQEISFEIKKASENKYRLCSTKFFKLISKQIIQGSISSPNFTRIAAPFLKELYENIFRTEIRYLEQDKDYKVSFKILKKNMYNHFCTFKIKPQCKNLNPSFLKNKVSLWPAYLLPSFCQVVSLEVPGRESYPIWIDYEKEVFSFYSGEDFFVQSQRFDPRSLETEVFISSLLSLIKRESLDPEWIEIFSGQDPFSRKNKKAIGFLKIDNKKKN